MRTKMGRLAVILIIVVGILGLYFGYRQFLAPPLKVVSNGVFDFIEDFLQGGRQQAPRPDEFLVVAVKVNRWPGELMSRGFELQYDEFPNTISVACYSMNVLPMHATKKATPTATWGQNATLKKRVKYAKLVFVVPASVTEATLLYGGKKVSTFAFNRDRSD